MVAVLSKEERLALLEEVSELIENIYICLSHSEQLTIPFIESGEYIQRGQFSDYIWTKLIEIKKTIDHLNKFGFKDFADYIKSVHDVIFSRDLPDSIKEDFSNFIVIMQSFTNYSKIWGGSIKTYLMVSKPLEKIIILRDRIEDEDERPKSWQTIRILGSYKYYCGYNRVKLLKGHDTRIVDEGGKSFWWELNFLDSNIQDVLHLTNTTSFDYFSLDPSTGRLSIFFTTPVQFLDIGTSGYYVELKVKGFYKEEKHSVLMDNEIFYKTFKYLPEDFIKKYKNKNFILLCRSDLTQSIFCYDAKEISFEDFKKRGFEALLRFRKVVRRNRKDIEIQSNHIGYNGDKIYYIPYWFRDNPDGFIEYVKGNKDIEALKKIVPIRAKLSTYFETYPQSLKLYREEKKFYEVNKSLIDFKLLEPELKEELKKKKIHDVEFKYHIPIRVYDGYPNDITKTIEKIKSNIQDEKLFRVHIILGVDDDVKIANDIIQVIDKIKFPKEGRFKWDDNFVIGRTRRMIYKYYYKTKPQLLIKNAA